VFLPLHLGGYCMTWKERMIAAYHREEPDHPAVNRVAPE
jgi:hypothetical protein